MKPPNPLPRRRPQNGFSLVEVVVAMFILSIAMAGAYRILTVSMQTRQVAVNHYVATVMANNRIERAKNLAFGELSTLAENERAVDELGVPDADGRYLRTTVVEESLNGDPTLTRITVSVVPPAPNRRSAEGLPPVSISTILNNLLQP